MSSALARDDGSQLLIVDPMQNKILAYNPTGTVVEVPEPELEGGAAFQPNAIAQIDEDKFLLELSDGNLVKLDRDFRTIGSHLLVNEDNRLRVGSMYQWKVAGNYLVAYGALLSGRAEVALGFFRVPLGITPQIPQMLTPLENSDFYLIGNSYITTIGSTAYYIVMDDNPAIYKVTSERGVPEKLSAFPEDFRKKPNFKTKMTSPRNADAHFAELETFPVVSGLYSQGDFLYVLAREPLSGKTGWYLYQIDPVADKVKSRLRLPTSMNHLTVAASKNNWFFIERGPVLKLQRQEIGTMLVVDASVIRSSAKLPDSCTTVIANAQANPADIDTHPQLSSSGRRLRPSVPEARARDLVAVVAAVLVVLLIVVIVRIRSRTS